MEKHGSEQQNFRKNGKIIQMADLEKIVRLGCILCRSQGVATTDSPVEVHHVRRFGGKRKNAPIVPLCAIHHRLGNTSYHALGAKGFERYWGISPEELVERTNALLEKN
jgi:hypothetical protein